MWLRNGGGVAGCRLGLWATGRGPWHERHGHRPIRSSTVECLLPTPVLREVLITR